MTRIAAIDCGTNSLRLLVCELGADGASEELVREMRIVRLGQDVDRTGMLAAGALERTRRSLAEYATIIDRHGVERVRMVATSATRDAGNRADFESIVTAELGISPEVISGSEEAELSYVGASSVLGSPDTELLVLDIGGGSTELVRGPRATLHAHSMDIGSVRMTERHLHDDPPTAEQVAAVVADVRAALGAARRDVPLAPAAPLVGVAGTVTTVAALALELPAYDRAAVHGARISVDAVREVTARLCALPHAGRAALPVIHPGRVDVITGGALILRTVLEELTVDSLVVSEHDILDGIALTLR